ncbi:MAG: 2-amino-4-hydroxy-6-hydroxymethyldihydropteridine diphosphokinase [Verrucomicrobiales bacterium]
MKVGIALGSNLGDRGEYILRAIERLRELHEGADADFLEASLLETEPVDCESGTPNFLNTVVELESSLAPVAILDFCQQIERDSGRPDVREKNSPRTVDVDMLYVGDIELITDRLILPHPRMHEREFVMAPLREIGVVE